MLCTEFGEKIGAEEAKRIGFTAVLSKPVVQNELAKMVRTELDAAKRF